MTQKRMFGVITYDVPTHMRKLYPKLRALFKRRALMQTQSAYLFPWGMAQEIEEGMQQINTHEGFKRPQPDQIRYAIFKYDEKVSGQALTESCRDALRKQIARMKENIHKKLLDVEKLEAGEEVDDEDLDLEDAIRSAKVTCRRGMSILKDMQAIALIFDLTDDMDAAFINYTVWVEEKKDRIKQSETQMKAALEAVEKEEETPMDGDELGDKSPSGSKVFSAPQAAADCPV